VRSAAIDDEAFYGNEFWPRYREPMVAYPFFARKLEGVLKLIAALDAEPSRSEGERPKTSAADWLPVIVRPHVDDVALLADGSAYAVTDRDREAAAEIAALPAEEQRTILELWFDQLLVDAGMRPHQPMSRDRVGLTLVLGRALDRRALPWMAPGYTGTTLFGLLVAHTWALLRTPHGMKVCKQCKGIYRREEGFRAYCSPECQALGYAARQPRYELRNPKRHQKVKSRVADHVAESGNQ
jgi:hypothetical protein